MRIAVVGSGVSGIGAALALSQQYDVTLIEKDARFGGHANTVTVRHRQRPIAVDTGFIVFNQRNYPNLVALLDHLGVASHWSDMSFGFSLDGGRMEYACDSLDKLFAQRRNSLSPRHLRMLRDILRFNREAPALMDAGVLDGLSLGDWLARETYSDWFRDRFILPMGGAIWSTPIAEMLGFPARSFVSFFRNHDLMTGLGAAQRWRTVTGGSREYVGRAIQTLGKRAQAGRAVAAVTRTAGRPAVTFTDGETVVFDHVVLATHAPQALGLMADADMQERTILGAFRTAPNRAVLHADPTLMPRRRKVWSSWNFLADTGRADTGRADTGREDTGRPAPVTYWMNRLQGIDPRYPLFVSLNPTVEPDPALIFGSFSYDHPLYDAAAFAAQTALDDIQGRGGLWYAGAWTGFGFHEDGLRAGLRVAAALGARPAWAVDVQSPAADRFARAAE
ncbi:MAG: FAD-dependent oxidoreductase [Pseudomonadota bacterium]